MAPNVTASQGVVSGGWRAVGGEQWVWQAVECEQASGECTSASGAIVVVNIVTIMSTTSRTNLYATGYTGPTL
jgi:hypothetical protein